MMITRRGFALGTAAAAAASVTTLGVPALCCAGRTDPDRLARRADRPEFGAGDRL